MENPIKVKISANTEFDLHHDGNNCYELIFENGELLTVNELMALNAAGYIWHSSLEDIEYEDELPGGGLRVGYMDIHYFAKAAEGIFTDCLPK